MTGKMFLSTPSVRLIVILAALLFVSDYRFEKILPHGAVMLQRQLFSTGTTFLNTKLKPSGYFETFVEFERYNFVLAARYRRQPLDWWGAENAIMTPPEEDGFRELRPSAQIQSKGVRLETNNWGMRDRERNLEPDPGTRRVALLGSSAEVGSGVRLEDTLPAQLERELNQTGDRRVEILNFAIPDSTPLFQAKILERKALKFKPSTVVFVARANDRRMMINKLVEMSQIGPGAINELARFRALVRDEDKLLFEVYRRVVDICAANGIAPIWVYIPLAKPSMYAETFSTLRPLAERAGFRTIGLSDELFDGRDISKLSIAPWDGHPNAAANEITAKALARELKQLNW